MKKLGLILITLILAAGMVFATDSSVPPSTLTSTVKITGTIAPTPSDNVDDNPVVGDPDGLWIYSYIETFNAKTITEPEKYEATDDLLDSETYTVDVLHETDGEDSIDSLAIVYGVLCDVAANSTNPPLYSISVSAPENWSLVGSTSTVDTLTLKVETSLPKETSIKLANSSDPNAVLKLDNETSDIKITTAKGLSNKAATEPQLVGWTAVTWDTVTGKTPVAGTYTADITITIEPVV